MSLLLSLSYRFFSAAGRCNINQIQCYLCHSPSGLMTWPEVSRLINNQPPAFSMKPDLELIRSYFSRRVGEPLLIKQLSTWLGRETKEAPPTATVQPGDHDSSAQSTPDRKPIHSRKTQKQTLRKAILNLRARAKASYVRPLELIG